jgi:hypothetical protein
LAIHGFVNGLLAAGETPSEVEESLGDLLQLEDAIDHALKQPGDVLPVIPADPVNVDDIPI